MECRLDNITVNYEIYGEGRPLLLLPGWTMAARVHAHIMEPHLQQRAGWQRIYIDPPGHGRTPGAASVTNLDQMLEILLACLDTIIPGQHFALHGYSLGAYLARGILHRRPSSVDGLSMLAPVAIGERARRTVPGHTVLIEDPQVMASLNEEERELMEAIIVRSPGFLAQMRAWPLLSEQDQSDYTYLETIHEDPDRYRFTVDVDALEQPFDKPSLIITGRQDTSVGYADAWRLIDNFPRATYVVFDRAGHFMEEKDALINPLINEWLDRVEETLA